MMEKLVCRCFEDNIRVEIHENLLNEEIADFVNLVISNNIRDFVIKESVTDISFLSQVNNQVDSVISQYPNTKLDISPVEDLTELTFIRFGDLKKKSLNLKKLIKLESLNIHWNDKISGFEFLENLEYLEINRYKLEDTSCLYLPRSIKHLVFEYSSITNLSMLKNTPRLERFELYYCNKIENLNGIGICDEINDITLLSCPSLIEIDAVSELKKLKKIIIENCKNLKSIESLRKIPNLQEPRQIGSTKSKW